MAQGNLALPLPLPKTRASDPTRTEGWEQTPLDSEHPHREGRKETGSVIKALALVIGAAIGVTIVIIALEDDRRRYPIDRDEES
ncbi:MAG: hypothetical protein Q8P13_02665 [bacterium]|nr:hypothetical protein [bacterium]